MSPFLLGSGETNVKLSQVFGAIAMVSVCSPALAGGAASVGTLTNATQGTFIARDGKMVPAKAGQSLYAGDRVVTRNGAKAKANFTAGCSYAIAPTSMLSVAPSACSSNFASLAVQDEAAGGAAAGGAGVSTTAIIIGVVAAAAVAGGVAAATSNTRTTSVSP